MKKSLIIFGENRSFTLDEVGGATEFFNRRINDKIKAEFLRHAKDIMRQMPMELRPKKVCVKDTTSRWGSCSSSGTISLSWRLSFAPTEVMRYVIIHECCHLAQMNHGPLFWALVRQHFGSGSEKAKAWLRKNGRDLFNES
jgi:predicted metal-dependent hydrolase